MKLKTYELYTEDGRLSTHVATSFCIIGNSLVFTNENFEVFCAYKDWVRCRLICEDEEQTEVNKPTT